MGEAMIHKALILAAIVAAVLAWVWLPWISLVQVGAVAIVVLGTWLIVRAHVVGFEYERRPRVWRAEWRSEDGPSQVEIARRIAEVQEHDEQPNRLEAGRRSA